MRRRPRKTAVQVRQILEAMDELKTSITSRFDAVDEKLGTIDVTKAKMDKMQAKMEQQGTMGWILWRN